MRLAKPLLLSSPEECEQAFYEALDAADSDAVSELWLEDDDVICIHPGGPRLTGYDAIRSSWTTILSHGPVHVRCTLIKSLETPTVALHNVIEEVVVDERRAAPSLAEAAIGSERVASAEHSIAEGMQQIVRVHATNAYVKTPAGWKMVLHHASPAPEGETSEGGDERRSHGVLH